jgi:pimeloyl-ACP methyl ester carboxylesterase
MVIYRKLKLYIVWLRVAELSNFYKPSSDPEKHIIFVHGLDGHVENTWKQADNDSIVWPVWLGEDLEHTSIWSVSYDAKKFGNDSMHLKQRGGSVFELLLTYPELQSGEIILVGHSFGGLVIKQLLRHANDQPSKRVEVNAFLDRVTKIVFLGTPHTGSSLATLSGKFGLFVTSSGVTKSLLKSDPHLVELKSWYKNWASERRIQNLALMEDRPTTFGKGIFKKNIWVVKPDSADPGVEENAVMVESDHFNICKPQTKESEVYRHIYHFIQKKNDFISLAERACLITEEKLKEASIPLSCWNKTIENKFIFRQELEDLKGLIDTAESRCYLLSGTAGSGKSSILSSLYDHLTGKNLTLLAIKADELDKDINDLSDLGGHLKLEGNITQSLLKSSETKPLVLLIDQMDAVSEVMDQSSNRFRVLVDLILALKEHFEVPKTYPIHIVISSRPFEASFDTRFTQLDATTINVTPPSKECIEEFLAEIGIKKSLVPVSMYPAIQIPFALSLYVSLVKSGESTANITSKNLLSRWLEKKLPNSSEHLFDFLRLLADDMVEHEVLRRPLEAYLFNYESVINTLESVGVIARYGNNIGFSHQAWLDDFQAQRFKSSEDIYQFILLKQNGLFSRSTILRGLEYLREYNISEYQKALDRLLFGNDIRRHILHLLVDIISTTLSPGFNDSERVYSIIKHDQVLARRIVSKTYINWANWRVLLVEYLPEFMGKKEHCEHASQWLVAESNYDENHVTSLIDRLWNEQENDERAFSVLSRSVANTSPALSRIANILPRTKMNQNSISRYIVELLKNKNQKSALKLLNIWLNLLDPKVAIEHRFYGISKYVKEFPLQFAKILMPWFIATIENGETHTSLSQIFRRSSYITDESEDNLKEDMLIGSLQSALIQSAKKNHTNFLEFIRPFMDVQLDEIQSIIAIALSSNAKELANEAETFLLENDFRLCLGDGFFQGEDNVSFSVNGHVTMILMEESVPHWDSEQIDRIQLAIENYIVYPATPELPLDLRRRTFRYSDEYRLTLLARLPSESLTPRRRQQVLERDSTREPKVGERSRGMGMASFVTSPISEEQMSKATDSDILNFFEKITSEQTHKWHYGRIVELSREFGRFALSHPERAFELMKKHFRQGIHEHASTYALEELSKSNKIPSSEIKELINTLNKRGFKSSEWVSGIARVFQEIAKSDKGLDDEDIALLVSFLESDKDSDTDPKELSEEDEPSGALLFGNRGGTRSLPSGNYIILSAIYLGLLGRVNPERDEWLDILLHFIDLSKDTETWECILLFQGSQLYWANQEKMNTLIYRLLTENPALFSTPVFVKTIWELVNKLDFSLLIKIVDNWLSSGKPTCIQASGELLTGIIISERGSGQIEAIWKRSFETSDVNFRRGGIYAACAGWYEPGKVRGSSHNILLKCLEGEVEQLSKAINSLFSYNKRMPSDELTFEALHFIADNPMLVAKLNMYGLIGSLVKLNPSPRVMKLVLNIAQHIVLAQQEKGQDFSYIEHADKLVELAVTLQRTSGALKEDAMTLYEKLLDAGSYRAEEAAEVALRGN